MKTNYEIAQDIIEGVILEDIGNSKELNEAIEKALQAKDAEHKKEMIELVESVPDFLGCEDPECQGLIFDSCEAWIKEQLNKLKA